MTDFRRYKLITGEAIVGDLVSGQECERRLISDAECYEFCTPSESGLSASSPVLVKTALKAAQSILSKAGTDAWRNALTDVARLEMRRTKGLFLGRREATPAAPMTDFSIVYLRFLENHINGIYGKRNIPPHFSSIIPAFLSEIMVANAFAQKDGPLRAVASAFRAGYFPLTWSGSFPDGHLEVYCPPDRAHARAGTVDAAATERRARARKEELIRQIRAHPGYADAPALPSDHLRGWDRLAQRGDAAAFAEHFAPLAATPAERELLQALATRVASIAIVDGELAIAFTVEDNLRVEMRCQAPWTGPLTHVPAEAIPLLRLHNGMGFIHRMAGPTIFPFSGSHYVTDYPEGIEEPPFNDEPWTLTPVLTPFSDGSDVYVYDPVQPGDGGRVRLRRVSHEMATIDGADVGCGLGSLFLRLVAQDLDVVSG